MSLARLDRQALTVCLDWKGRRVTLGQAGLLDQQAGQEGQDRREGQAVWA